MKRSRVAARDVDQDAGLERIKHLEVQLALTPVNGRQHRTLLAAIRMEAQAYRKSLDFEQASARYTGKP